MPGFLADVLHRPHNYSYRVMVETAQKWGLPPTQVMLGRPTEWSADDTKLSTALVVLEKETCRDCGQPAWLGHSTDRNLTFKSESTHCYGCMELEKRREDKENKVGKGEKPYVVAKMWDDSPLPGRAEALARQQTRE